MARVRYMNLICYSCDNFSWVCSVAAADFTVQIRHSEQSKFSNSNVLLLRQFEAGWRRGSGIVGGASLKLFAAAAAAAADIMPWGNRSFQSMMILTQQRSWDTVVCDEMWTG